MTDADHLWTLEHDYWTCGEGQRRETTDTCCVMAFGSPTGIVTGEELHEAHDAAPDWTSVEMLDRVLKKPDVGVAVLGYRAHARTQDGGEHRVICTSVWVRHDSDWCHIQHQQTPE
ncbi:hypothetical protein [Tranquillimonas alkanivorans]|uniref:DUF4440 domain-containing protein n=1 Tax=Tranquillimonas alkanivorans TaxID=441119 RepID=A0A1I5ND26_9RHOB|nr:hypothetical protein [Tranquillimonas alkanivorans]SFP19580.1 hypothetical protein SAMN04488047_103216 [Tranquillimonas alkanivorans]